MNNYEILKKHEKEFGSDMDIDESLLKDDLIQMQNNFTVPITGCKNRTDFEWD